MIRRTKIIAILGPSSEKPSIVKQLVEEGVNVFRLNFAHGNKEDHQGKVDLIRKLDLPVEIMADVPGSKIRIGQLPVDGVNLMTGSDIVIEFDKSTYESNIIPIPFSSKISLGVGDKIFLDDGAITLEVKSLSKRRILCEVLH